jgi:hypothetical protein
LRQWREKRRAGRLFRCPIRALFSKQHKHQLGPNAGVSVRDRRSPSAMDRMSSRMMKEDGLFKPRHQPRAHSWERMPTPTITVTSPRRQARADRRMLGGCRRHPHGPARDPCCPIASCQLRHAGPSQTARSHSPGFGQCGEA